MPSLLEPIHQLTNYVLEQPDDLDGAVAELERWFDEHADRLSDADRRAFSAALDVQSTNDNRSLVDSVLKLHMTRLLYRLDRALNPSPISPAPNQYTLARTAFTRAMEVSEDVINKSRIDIAVANAHHLLGNATGNRRWLDRALDRLPPLATTNLVTLAQAIPSMPIPRLNAIKRLGLRFMGFDFARLDQDNRDSLSAIARMQIDQMIILAHLIGSSFEVIRERQRAQRAFRIAAHLIMRHEGMRNADPDQLMAIAESLLRSEPEAARQLAEQAHKLYVSGNNAEGIIRAEKLIEDSQ